MGRFVAERAKLQFGFSGTMKLVHELDQKGFTRLQVCEQLGLSLTMVAKGLRIYLGSLGKTPDSGHLEVKNKAIELVKRLDADEISVNGADIEFVSYIKQVTGRGVTTRTAATVTNPDQQLSAYERVIGQLEGMCYGLDKLPEIIHSSISVGQRSELVQRLANCRRILERRINIIRKDENAEARNQEG